MKFNNIENKCYLIGDKEVWDSRSVTVVGMILVNHENDIYVLLGKRGEGLPNAVGRWCMPCGYLDKNETLEEAIVREIWEETGLNINKAINNYSVLYDHMHYPWRIDSNPNTTTQSVSMHYAVYLKTEKGVGGELEQLPKLNSENNVDPMETEELEWVKVDELHNYDIAFGHDNIITVFVRSLPVND